MSNNCKVLPVINVNQQAKQQIDFADFKYEIHDTFLSDHTYQVLILEQKAIELEDPYKTECGCACKKCSLHDQEVHLHVEIENLKQKLLERENHIVTMETNFLNEANKFPNGEFSALREELLTWQDKYRRLYDAHRRVQRVNQGLEDKLLRLVDSCETEKGTLTRDIASLSHKLAEANYTIKKLSEDNERYKSDVALAIQFLQCKQSNFVAKKFESLPQEVQSQVSSHMTIKKKPEEKKISSEMKSIKVPIPTFPPTAMVYSVSKSANSDRKVLEEKESQEVDIVSAAIMAKVLEERQRERAFVKHCDTCTCSKSLKIIHNNTHHSISTQTASSSQNMSCLKCNDNSLLKQAQSIPVVIVKENSTTVKVPIHASDYSDNLQNNPSNVVKVQPNNFLLDNEHVSYASSKSSLIDLDSNISSHRSDYNNKSFDNISMYDERNISDNKISLNKNTQGATLKNAQTIPVAVAKHHRLCKNNSSLYSLDTADDEKVDVEKQVDKSVSKNENVRGPRYCSVLESGKNNILLDNTHNNVAPVLYTRQNKIKSENTSTSRFTSQGASTSSEDLRSSSVLGCDSDHNEQRVAEWIQSTIDIDPSSSDNSRSDSINKERKANVDKAKYQEMEDNVKRFLFGESEFMKTVELGKLKYMIIKENDSENCPDGHNSTSTKSTPFSETRI